MIRELSPSYFVLFKSWQPKA